jgi:hypothetical protein
MRIPLSSGVVTTLAAVVVKWFQPLAVIAVILTVTLVAALRRADQLKSWRQWPIVAIMLGSGLAIAIAFLVAVQWIVRMGVL